VRDIMYS